MLNVSVDLQVSSAVDSDCVMSPLPGLVYYLQRYYLIKILIHYANDFSVHFHSNYQYGLCALPFHHLLG